MRFGRFDDTAREYVIERPDTPASWSNYLGSTEYGAVITNNAGGYGFYKSAAQGRFLRLRFNAVPADQPGRYVYLRDRQTGDFWSASWQPVGKPLDRYESTCRHGTGYTVIDSRYEGIQTETTYFVPLGRCFECWIVKVANLSGRARRLSAFTYLEYANTWNTHLDLVNLQYSQHIVQCRLVDGMIEQLTNLNVPERPDDFQNTDQCRRTFLGLVGATPAGYETDRQRFLGPHRTYANPLTVETGCFSGSMAYGDNACGVMQIDLDLAPGQQREFLVLLGVGRADREGTAAREKIGSVADAEAALAELKAYWHGRLGALVARTPDAELDTMVNVWNAYNALITFSWSRAASLIYSGERDGLGYRDTVQDILGVMSAIPDEARERLELMMTGQSSEGGAMPVVKPFAHRPGREPPVAEDEYRSDDCLWLFDSVAAYVKETGDLAFYDRELRFADAGVATVLGHLRRAMEFNLHRRGAHGLPCGLSADWNDCLRLGHRGESVFVALQLRHALRTYVEACDRLGRQQERDWAQGQLAETDTALQRHAWDGQWFLRAFREDGTPLGGRANAEASIFLNVQSWAVISGVADPNQARQVMNAVHERLSTEYGLTLCAPPFERESIDVVRAILFNPGLKENAGIFSQTQPWAVMAEALLGRGDRAYAYYRAFMPAAYNDRAEVRQIEPYVHCQYTHSPFSRQCGTSRVPWLTGTASWSYVAATQYLLGLRPDYDGLRIDPCIPAAWDGFEVTRRFRGATYHVQVRNPRRLCQGVRRMTVDGRRVVGSLVPLCDPGGRCHVEAELEGIPPDAAEGEGA